MQRPLNVAVVGLGVGEQHAHAVLRDGRAALRYVSDLDAQKAESFCRIHGGGAARVAPYNDIITDRETDIVSIASYDDAHFMQVMTAMGEGKHVFVEKPLCQTDDELTKIHALWSQKKTALASNLILRSAALYRWLKDYIAAGNMGDIYAFDGDYLYGRLHKITEGWRADVDNYSVMEGGGIHIIDLMMHLTGQKPNAVTAQANKIASRDTAFRFPDFHAATFTFDSGMIGRITANFGCVHRHHHIIRIFGTKETFVYDDMGPRLHRTRDPAARGEMLPYNPLPENKGMLIPGFIDTVISGDVAAAARTEFDLMSAVLAADSALHTKTQEKIRYLPC